MLPKLLTVGSVKKTLFFKFLKNQSQKTLKNENNQTKSKKKNKINVCNCLISKINVKKRVINDNLFSNSTNANADY